MFCLEYPEREPISPPCVGVITLLESDGDKRVLSELLDLEKCTRAPSEEVRRAGQNGRVSVTPLCRLLGIHKEGDLGDAYAETMIAKALEATKSAGYDVSREQLLHYGFWVRFFEY